MELLQRMGRNNTSICTFCLHLSNLPGESRENVWKCLLWVMKGKYLFLERIQEHDQPFHIQSVYLTHAHLAQKNSNINEFAFVKWDFCLTPSVSKWQSQNPGDSTANPLTKWIPCQKHRFARRASGWISIKRSTSGNVTRPILHLAHEMSVTNIVGNIWHSPSQD